MKIARSYDTKNVPPLSAESLVVALVKLANASGDNAEVVDLAWHLGAFYTGTLVEHGVYRSFVVTAAATGKPMVYMDQE